jgi:8-oxo-dGTP pyrophosphatase MutT (NUDIX family)
MAFAVDPALRSRLAARADIDPLAPRAPLRSADGRHTIGSLDSALARRLVDEGLLLPDSRAGTGWRLPDATDTDAALAAIARWLQANGLGGRWRNEMLAVDNAEGVPVAAIERAAVRPLGIATHAVHLVGQRADANVWVQQRALDKATDPGLWDTLMGGLVSAHESIATTLERETWEEAGLRIAELDAVQPFTRISVRRPVSDGYMVEHIEVFEAVVPDGLVPQNQDGEVERFDCIAPAELHERLRADTFTLEAALILTSWLAAR